MKETEDDRDRWRDIPCSWIGRINIVKVNILIKTMNRFNEVPIKIPMINFCGIPVVKNLPANAGDTGFDPWSRKIPRASEQLSLCALETGSTVTEAPEPRDRALQQEKPQQ